MNYKIINGDCVEEIKKMPDKSVDIVITSPPYNTLPVNRKNTGRLKDTKWLKKAIAGYSSYNDSKPEDEYQEWINNVIGECLRISKGVVWINHKVRYRNRIGIHPLKFIKYDLFCEIIWQRSGGVAFNSRRYVPNHESIYGFGTPHFWDGVNDHLFTVWKIAQVSNNDHPCVFPIQIPERLIASSCPIGGIILDPFCGIGTTGIAAMMSKRDFIGIEIDKKYAGISEINIKNAKDKMDGMIF